MISIGCTGAFSGDSTQLLYLRARHYAPGMGRFLTRDTWRGDADLPMSHNAWLYAFGNPFNHVDPTGNFPASVTFSGQWPDLAKSAVEEAVTSVARKFSRYIHGGPDFAFTQVYGQIDFEWNTNCYGCRPKICIDNNKYDGTMKDPTTGYEVSCTPKGGFTNSASSITFASMFLTADGQNYLSNATSEKLRNNVVHELGHAFDDLLNDYPSTLLGLTQTPGSFCYNKDFPNRVNLSCPKGDPNCTGPYYGFHSQQGVLLWQMNSSGDQKEEFADMFLGWTFNKWEINPKTGGWHERGLARAMWMETNMSRWLRSLSMMR